MIWNFCIRRPVLTTVIFFIIAIFGIFGYMSIPVREFPDIDFPMANVNVTLRGADPEVIETEIIEPLEAEINTVEGLKELRSTAREQVGTVTAEFELWRDVDIAVQDVRDRVERARRRLPEEADAPVVRKMDPDEQPVLWIAMLGDENWDMTELTEYIDDYIQPRLEGLRGVGRVQVGGSREYAARVLLDPHRMAAHNVTARKVIGQIQSQNVEFPAGRVEGEQREFLIKTRGMFSEAAPLNDLVIAERAGETVRLADIGKVEDGVRNERIIARFGGQPTVGMGVIRQADANTVEVVDTARAELETIAEELPPGLDYVIAMDGSRFIRESIFDLQTTILIATAIVMLVIIFFLRTFWGTIVIGLAIPTSLATGMALIYSFGFSMNILTLLAFILVIGIVVDDAIVVLESTYRHLEEGAATKPAARVGTTEIAFAAIANTLSLGAVFIPVAFTRGMIGRIFFEFGVTAAVTVFASTFTALTLAPMLNSRFLSEPSAPGFIGRTIDSFINFFRRIYSRLLDWSLKHRFIVILAAILIFIAGIYLFLNLSHEFQPDVDTSEFMVSFNTPVGATLAETEQYAQRLENIMEQIPEVDTCFMAIGMGMGGGPGRVTSGVMFIRLIDPAERDEHQRVIMNRIRREAEKTPGGQAFVRPIGGPGGGRGEGEIAVALQNPDLEELAAYSEQLQEWMRGRPEFVGVDVDLELESPQVEISFLRDRMVRQDISVLDISQTLRFFMGEPEISEVEREASRYQVISQISQPRVTPSIIDEIKMRGKGGELVPLANLIDWEETTGASEIGHFNRMRAAIVSASTPPDVVTGDALNLLEERLDKTMPAGFSREITGTAEMMQESFEYLTESLLLGILFVYLVMAAQFESWLHPLTILMSLPLAGVGAFGLLYIFDMTFSVFTFIGIIMLVGLVTKNGILLVDYTNVLLARGYELLNALREAGHVRFRPVIMTAISTILGMMPIALGYGMGGEARAPMGWAVAGGMFSATALTLLVIPVVYSIFADLELYINKYWQRLIKYFHGVVSLLLAGWLFWQSVVLFRGGLSGGILAFLGLLLLVVVANSFRSPASGYNYLIFLTFPGLIIGGSLLGLYYLIPELLPPVIDWPASLFMAIGYCLFSVLVVYLWPFEEESV